MSERIRKIAYRHGDDEWAEQCFDLGVAAADEAVRRVHVALHAALTEAESVGGRSDPWLLIESTARHLMPELTEPTVSPHKPHPFYGNAPIDPLPPQGEAGAAPTPGCRVCGHDEKYHRAHGCDACAARGRCRYFVAPPVPAPCSCGYGDRHSDENVHKAHQTGAAPTTCPHGDTIERWRNEKIVHHATESEILMCAEIARLRAEHKRVLDGAVFHERRAHELDKEIDRLLAQLPEGMKHCTIVLKQCGLGHSWLTATNWVDFPCPICEMSRLRAETERLHRWKDVACGVLTDEQLDFRPTVGGTLRERLRAIELERDHA